MKHFTRYYFLFIAASLIIISCGKDGATGPIGPTGATGATGAVGPAGPAGANGTNGSIIYSGTTNPATTVGVTGDFYINLITGVLFGPKTATGWGNGIALRGAAGATGAAGSQIYSGAGAPAGSVFRRRRGRRADQCPACNLSKATRYQRRF